MKAVLISHLICTLIANFDCAYSKYNALYDVPTNRNAVGRTLIPVFVSRKIVLQPRREGCERRGGGGRGGSPRETHIQD